MIEVDLYDIWDHKFAIYQNNSDQALTNLFDFTRVQLQEDCGVEVQIEQRDDYYFEVIFHFSSMEDKLIYQMYYE